VEAFHGWRLYQMSRPNVGINRSSGIRERRRRI
jgi:hypothetical protein